MCRDSIREMPHVKGNKEARIGLESQQTAMQVRPQVRENWVEMSDSFMKSKESSTNPSGSSWDNGGCEKQKAAHAKGDLSTK